jgi:hypothetical protein
MSFTELLCNSENCFLSMRRPTFPILDNSVPYTRDALPQCSARARDSALATILLNVFCREIGSAALDPHWSRGASLTSAPARFEHATAVAVEVHLAILPLRLGRELEGAQGQPGDCWNGPVAR